MTALPPNAQRHLVRMRSLEPPIDLVDGIMAEVEATPQVRSPDLRTVSGFVLAAAAVLLALAILLRFGVPDVGPAPTPVPLDQLPSAGSVVLQTSVAAGDVPSAFGHGYLWITNAATGELIRMDPTNGSIVTPLVVTDPGSAVPIAITDASVWVADARDGSLVELNPDTREELQRIPVGGTVSAIAADGADLWILDADAGEVAQVETADGTRTLTVPVEGAAALLVHAGSVWVGDTTGAVVRIDPATGDASGRVEVGMPVRRLLANDGAVLALGALDEPIVRVDIGAMEISTRGASVLDAAAMEDGVWAVLGSGHLVRLDPATLQPAAADLLEVTGADTLASGGGWVWTSGLDEFGTSLLQVTPAD